MAHYTRNVIDGTKRDIYKAHCQFKKIGNRKDVFNTSLTAGYFLRIMCTEKYRKISLSRLVKFDSEKSVPIFEKSGFFLIKRFKFVPKYSTHRV